MMTNDQKKSDIKEQAVPFAYVVADRGPVDFCGVIADIGSEKKYDNPRGLSFNRSAHLKTILSQPRHQNKRSLKAKTNLFAFNGGRAEKRKMIDDETVEISTIYYL